MDTIMIAIKPEWVQKILSGEKTIEVRKTAPKPPFKAVIYCTKGGEILREAYYVNGKPEHRMFYFADRGRIHERGLNGKVVAEFICDSVSKFDIDGLVWWGMKDHLLEIACLTEKQLRDYICKNIGYGWHISDLKIYDKPKELGEFNGYCKKKKECYADVVRHCNDSHFDWKCNKITRPPQSWQYIQEEV